MLVVFTVTILFGFTIMNHGMDGMQNGCILGFLNSAICPQSTFFTMALHHIGAYQSFSNSLNVFSLISILLSLVVILILFSLYTATDSLYRYKSLAYIERHTKNTHNQAILDERAWLSQLNNSPSRI